MPRDNIITSRRWSRSSNDAGIRVSLFIAAEPAQIEAAANCARR